MEDNNKNSQLFDPPKNRFPFYNYLKFKPYLGNVVSAIKTDNVAFQRGKFGDRNYPYRIQDVSEESLPKIELLTPAIFGGLGAFMVGSLLKRRSVSENFTNKVDKEISGQYLERYSSGFRKLEFFINILSIISLLGCTAYIYEEIKRDGGIRRFTAVLPTVLIIIFLFASEDYLLYTVCPGCYEGVVSDSRVGDFLNFVALSIGAISVGESYGITPKTTGTKLLLAQESLFNLFVLALLISFVV